MNTAVNQMDQVTQQNAAMVEEATAAAVNLRAESQELTRLVERFKTSAVIVRAGRPAAVKAGARHTAAPNPVARQQAKLAAAVGQSEWNEF